MSSISCFFALTLIMLLAQTPTYAAWTKQNSGTLAWLRSIHFVSPEKGWTVGSQGTFLTTNDGGKTWLSSKKFTTNNILDVYFITPQDGWLLCEADIYVALGSNSPSYLLHTTDGGITWERIGFPKGKERVARIFFSPNRRGFAVGENGGFWKMTNDAQEPWKKVNLSVQYLILSGDFTDDFKGVVVGGGGTVLLTEDAGLSWQHTIVPGETKPKLNSVFFVNHNTGWAAGNQGKIYFTNNGGKLWHEQSTNSIENLLDIFFINDSEGFAVGDNGSILHTTTSGKMWSLKESPSKHKLEKIFFINNRGFAVGFGGTILTYTAG